MIHYEGSNYTQAQFATYQAAKSQDANSLSADPKLTDAAGDDFHLESDSPCRHAGTDVGLTQDYAGLDVTQFHAFAFGKESKPSIGAYEVPAIIQTTANLTDSIRVQSSPR